MTFIQTERLIIRSWQESDAADLFQLCSVSELVLDGCRLYSDISETIKDIRWQMEKNEIFAIIQKESDKLIGYIGFTDMNRYEGYNELDYKISLEYRNLGYATEALRRMLDYAFGDMGLSVVAAWTRSHNAICAHVLEKCGFTFEGRLRQHARDKSDTMCYSMLKEEWEGL